MPRDVSTKEVEITIEPAQASDMAVLLQWRNHPDVRKNSFNSAQLTQEEHEAWFRKKMKDPDTVIYMACAGEEKVGSIRFDDTGDVVKASVMLNPAYFGRGLGAKVISAGAQRFMHDRQTVKPIVAEIKSGNTSSIKAFEKAGFKERFATYILDEKREDA